MKMGGKLKHVFFGTTITALMLFAMMFSACPFGEDLEKLRQKKATDTFVPVTDITGVPAVAVVGTSLTLSGMVAPSNATNHTIAWSVQSAGTTGATISGSTLNTTAAGTAVITASIANGSTLDTPYTQNFSITVNAAFVNVTFSGLGADGSTTATSTKLTLTFNMDIAGLSAADITLSAGSTGVVKGSLSRTGPGVYDLSLSGITATGMVTASPSRTGYEFSPTSRTATVNYAPPTDAHIKKVTFTGATAAVTFNNLSGKDIYLVKVNTSATAAAAATTGGARVSSPSLSNAGIGSFTDEELPRMGHPAADEFNANPPPIIEEPPLRTRAPFVPPVVGSTRSFWVEQYYNNGVWQQKQATLRATGSYGNIWVMDGNFDPVTSSGKKINTARAQELANKFDQIYLIETELLGYEFGGGPGGDGGRDGDPKIQILIYDIVNSAGTVQAGGYFWSKDYYQQNQLGTQKTNLAEIFYVDTTTANSGEYTYSLLVHEFQHMIHFNQKTVKRGVNSASWYNEMLSLMAEDVIGPMVGVPSSNWYHPQTQRIPRFLATYYEVGISEWGSGTPNEVSSSYAKAYGFGSYLMRNYGGANLLKELISNNLTNENSVTAALNAYSAGLNFQQALTRLGEAMIFSGSPIPADTLTYDTTVSNTINGHTYTAYAFNIWNISRTGGGTGPYIFDLSQQNMRPHSITVHSANEWKNKSGNFTITLDRPTNSSVEFYLMAK